MTEFEGLNQVWREERFDGSLFEKPASAIVPGIKERLQRARVKSLVHDVLNAVTALVSVALFGSLLIDTHSFLGRLGLAFLILGMAMIGIEIVLHRIESRYRDTGLSLRAWYLAERAKVDDAIRMRRRIWLWSAIFGVIGFVPFLASTHSSLKEMAFFYGVLAALIWTGRRVNEQRICRDLQPVSEELGRKLEALEDGPENPL